MTDNRHLGPIEAPLRRSLEALIAVGRMTRGHHDDYFSDDGKVRMPRDIARRLKSRRLIVSGFNRDIVATDKGRRGAKGLEIDNAE